MPTGYTAAIKDGISFKEYAMSCARAFGALVMMRDEPANAPIPDEFKPTDYHIKALEKAQSELKRIQSLTDDDCQREMEKERKEKIEHAEKGISETNVLRQKYNTMLLQAKAYIPPAPDHEGFKKFMVEQIEQSIDFDCSTDYYRNEVKKFPKDIGAWRGQKIDKAMWDINYHTKENTEEIHRTNSRNLWIKQLRESLEK